MKFVQLIGSPTSCQAIDAHHLQFESTKEQTTERSTPTIVWASELAPCAVCPATQTVAHLQT